VTGRRAAIRLGVACAAVLLAAADTYVVVLALPAMIGDVGVSIDQLQKATPILSGFLLGYVAVMPLIGRLSDVYGRRPVLLACLAMFAAGSLITASAHDLGTVVAGRALQGLGGGGLVPVTLAVVADMWPAERRGFPLGIVGALQELGSVLGPLYGAAILTVSTWRTIFWVNLPISAALATGLLAARPLPADGTADRRREGAYDWLGTGLAACVVASAALTIAAPSVLVDSDALGTLFSPVGPAWITPLTLTGAVAGGAFLCWEAFAPARVRAFARPGAIAALAQRADWVGSALLAAALAAVVVSFTSSDPSRQAISPSAAVLLPLAAVLVGLFVIRERSTANPLVDLRAFGSGAAAGALLTNLATGAALMTALVDVPILARVTVSPDSQLGAAAVLLRLLAALPVGALAGGWLCQRFGNRATAVIGLATATAMLGVMASWTARTLSDPLGLQWLHPSDPVLVAAGLGFGLVIAPVNAAMLGAVRASVHGLASALVVVARMIGMLVGISVLTAVGLQAFFSATRTIPSPQALCPSTPLSCSPYNRLVTAAVVDELRTVFLGAAVCAAVAAAIAALTLRGRSRL
jgi:MFS family permease